MAISREEALAKIKEADDLVTELLRTGSQTVQFKGMNSDEFNEFQSGVLEGAQATGHGDLVLMFGLLVDKASRMLNDITNETYKELAEEFKKSGQSIDIDPNTP